jgi:hypothetical protein
LVINDILQVIYAPQKAFKKIIENPKYIGAIIILILFVGIELGYEYSQISKIEIEQTSPTIDQLSAYTNATMWSTATNINVTNNFNDYFNYTIYQAGYGYYPNLFGNNSLKISATNTNNIIASLGNINVICDETGFQNLTMVTKLTQPQTTPQNATITLYSLSNTNYYQYDLTPALSNASNIGQWNNITIPVGKTATGWTTSGSPNWRNITALTLSANYPANSNITINIGALFFRGEYQTLIQLNSTGFLLNFLQQFSLQFLFTWFLLTGLIYVFFRGLKNAVLWKPLFIALGFALFVMVIRALISLIATLTLPTVYYTFDLWPGLSLTAYGTAFYPAEAAGTLFAQSQAALTTIAAQSEILASVTVTVFFISYIWLGALGVIIMRALKPEFSALKRIAISAVSIAVTLLVLLLLGVGA